MGASVLVEGKEEEEEEEEEEDQQEGKEHREQPETEAPPLGDIRDETIYTSDVELGDPSFQKVRRDGRENVKEENWQSRQSPRRQQHRSNLATDPPRPATLLLAQPHFPQLVGQSSAMHRVVASHCRFQVLHCHCTFLSCQGHQFLRRETSSGRRYW